MDAPICTTCPRGCTIPEGKFGACKARSCSNGQIVCANYGRITSLALDPIEKKPLARYKPGSTVLSLGSYGCNLTCPFCQNWSISTAGEEEVAWRYIEPEDIVRQALDVSPSQKCVGIAYTYNEPLVGWEFVSDCSKLAHEHGLDNVLVSNGCVNPEVITGLAPLIDAANIDLKCFSHQGYKSVGGDLDAVKRSTEMLVASGSCHVEVTTLVVPGFSDDERLFEEGCRWLAGLDPDITYHITRFFPCYKCTDKVPTPKQTLYKLAEIAGKHLSTVLIGNC